MTTDIGLTSGETTLPERKPSDRRTSPRPQKDDRECWVCGAPTVYRLCKIICTACGFTRDCSDP
ncbi:MAG: hypothetical protein IT330_05225 [Anaerolineae bacterium]|nr:hypothetical protein [Anaerolineae bacterium]